MEGFSNLLYVLLLTPAAALVSPEHLYAVSAGLNVVFALAALVLVYRFTLRRLGERPAAAVAMLVALCPSLWVWVASGLETSLVLLVQVATWVLAERCHPGEVLAIDSAGKVPFFSGLWTLDMLGLTDVHIAHGQVEDPKAFFRAGHAKSDFDYVLSRRPNLISGWLGGHLVLVTGPVVEPEKLARAGYRLAYLVNSAPRSKERNVVDVRSLPSAEILRLNNDSGYRMGVFERTGSPPEPR